MNLQENLSLRALGKGWYWYLAVGFSLIVGGILANTGIPGNSSGQIMGWTFLVAGVLYLLQAFLTNDDLPSAWAQLMGITSLLLGVVLLLDPLANLVSAPILAGILTVMLGLGLLIYGSKLRPNPGWLWMTLSGLLSLIIALLILIERFLPAFLNHGLLLTIELLSTGLLLILAGLSIKRLR